MSALTAATLSEAERHTLDRFVSPPDAPDGERMTIDRYDEDEALMGFENAFDEDAHLPRPGSVLDEPVEVISIGPRNGRRELIASCQHAGQRHDIALLDVNIDAQPALSRLIAAYRRWLSMQDGAT